MPNIYEQAQQSLFQKDGTKHVLMMRTVGRYRRESSFFDSDYNYQINELLYFMQINGYEIIDIKVTVLNDIGSTGYPIGYQTMIIYR
jgi:Muconolactone delta-isomerase.